MSNILINKSGAIQVFFHTCVGHFIYFFCFSSNERNVASSGRDITADVIYNEKNTRIIDIGQVYYKKKMKSTGARGSTCRAAVSVCCPCTTDYYFRNIISSFFIHFRSHTRPHSTPCTYILYEIIIIYIYVYIFNSDTSA